MDAAAMRRFNLKVEFDYLTQEGRLLFFDKMLSCISGHPLNKAEKEMFKRVEFLTPGDFRVVQEKFVLMPRDKANNVNLVNALEYEVQNKNELNKTRIGF
jgi:hypothetical protein